MKIRHTEKSSHNPRTTRRQMEGSVVVTDSRGRSTPSLQESSPCLPLPCRQLETNCARQGWRGAPATACSMPLPLEKAQHSGSRHGSLTRGPLRAIKRYQEGLQGAGQGKVQLLRSTEGRAPASQQRVERSSLSMHLYYQFTVNSRVSSAGNKSVWFKLKVYTHTHLYLCLQ